MVLVSFTCGVFFVLADPFAVDQINQGNMIISTFAFPDHFLIIKIYVRARS